MPQVKSAKTVDTITVELNAKEVESILYENAHKILREQSTSMGFIFTKLSIAKDGYSAYSIRFIKEEMSK